MRFKNHRLEGAEFMAAKAIGGKITPTLVVLHDTASRLEKGNAARYLASNSRGVSVHFVIERDGTIVQQVPTNRRANHAGKSSYHGQSECNDFSIGIEIVNPGRMTLRGVGTEALGVAWYKEAWPIAENAIHWGDTPEHGGGYWMDYTAEQLEAVEALLAALFDYIPSLTDVRGHWYVSPGRKIDPNPLFPMEAVRARTLGREEPAERAADDQATDVEYQGDFISIEVQDGCLNMRRWPSFNPNVIATIPGGTNVPVLKQGTFGGRRWLKVLYGDQEGWVVESYTAPIIFEA